MINVSNFCLVVIGIMSVIYIYITMGNCTFNCKFLTHGGKMRKVRLFLAFVLIAILSVSVFVGCDEEDYVSSISLKDYDPDTAIEISFDGFDYNLHTLLLTYSSGKVLEIPLTEDMISETDRLKFYKDGVHDITVSYANKSCIFKVLVKRATFQDISFPENNVFTYDGKPHTVEVKGDIPANAVVTYPGGNSFVNAGTYNVCAIITCDGYVTANLSTTVTVERAKYDMSGVKFEAKEFVYDGYTHSVEISGNLPDGVSSPKYTIDGKNASGAIKVGEYEVTASFATNDPNYEPIPDMKTTLTITQAEYVVKGVDIVFKNEGGKLIDGAYKIYDGASIVFDLDDYSKISKKLSVSFSVFDRAGNKISDSNKKTNIKNAGVYVVTVNFTHADGENYKSIAPIVRTFEVLKSEYPPLDNIHLISAQTTYDTKSHSLIIDGKLPDGVTVTYEYYRDNILLVDGNGNPVQSVTDVGIYTVKAVFAHNDPNCTKIDDMSASLNIKKATLPITMLGFTIGNTVEYDGTPHKATFKTWKEVVGVQEDVLKYSEIKYSVYDINSGKYVEMGENELPLEVGSYRASIDISVADKYASNYVLAGTSDLQTIVKQFEIVKKSVELPSVDFTSDFRFDYNGQEHKIEYTCNADSTLTTTVAQYYKYASGTYVAMENGQIPTNAGMYKLVVTVAVKDFEHYAFSSGETAREFSFEFDIAPQTLDVSRVALSYTSSPYNGTNQIPTVINLPAYVTASAKFYSRTGSTQIFEIVNAGKYRAEIVLKSENSNFALTLTEKLVFNFEILPVEINVDGLEFDSTELFYNGKTQHPVLKDLPEHVTASYTVHWGNDVNNNAEIYDGKRLALDTASYGCIVNLSAENPNYILRGQTTYSAQFEILPHVIDIASLFGNELVIEYTGADLSAAVVKAAHSQIDPLVGSIRYLDGEGQWQASKDAVARNSYKITCQLRLIDSNNYTYLYNSQLYDSVTVEIYFKIV